MWNVTKYTVTMNHTVLVSELLTLHGGFSGHDQLHGFLRHLPYVDLLCVKLGGDTL